nr:hypothetical protein [Tanacetum cinerariifolium]
WVGHGFGGEDGVEEAAVVDVWPVCGGRGFRRNSRRRRRRRRKV